MAVTDANGEYEVEGLVDAPHIPRRMIAARSDERGPSIRKETGVVGDIELDFVLEGALLTPEARGLRGRVIDAQGRPVSGARIQVDVPTHQPRRQEQGGRWIVRAPFGGATRTDGAGQFFLRGRGEGAVLVEVRSAVHAPFARRFTAAEWAQPLEIVLGFAGSLAASEIGDVRATLWKIGGNTGRGVEVDHSTGLATRDRMPEGRYRFDVQAPGHARSIRWFEAGVGESVQLSDIVLSEGGRIECDAVLNFQEEYPGRLELRRLDEEGRQIDAYDLFEVGDEGGARDGRSGTTTLIEPGTHRIAVVHSGSEWQETMVTVRDGETTRIEPVLEPGTHRRVAIQEADGAVCGCRLLHEAFDERGERHGTISESRVTNLGYRLVGHLGIGTYTVRVTDEFGRTADGTFEVIDLHRPLRGEIALTLTMPEQSFRPKGR